MSLDHKYKQELHRLEKGSPPIEDVYKAVGWIVDGHELRDGAEAILWGYFYPVALRNALEYFKDEEDARSVAFEFMEQWIAGAVLQYQEDKAKITPFFKHCMKNYYHRAYEIIQRGPVLISENDMQQGSDPDANEQDDGEVPVSRYMEAKVQFGEVYSYPYTGAESDILDKIMDNEKLSILMADLYPGEQEVLKLLVEGYSTEEIQEITNRTPAAVNQSMARIRSAI